MQMHCQCFYSAVMANLKLDYLKQFCNMNHSHIQYDNSTVQISSHSDRIPLQQYYKILITGHPKIMQCSCLGQVDFHGRQVTKTWS